MIMKGISDNELGITFNGVHSRDFGLRLKAVSDPMPTLTDVTQDVQPIIGDVYQGTNIQSKTINVTFHLVGAKSYQDKYTRMHEIMAWLMPLNGEECELTIDYLPNKSFYAHVSASFDLTDSLYNATFTVPFTCSDPRAYGPIRQYQLGARNLAQGTGVSFISSTKAGEQVQLYGLDGETSIYDGKITLSFDWTASTTGTIFKIRKAIVTDDGATTYTDLSTVTANATDGTSTVTINWQPIAGNQMTYLAYQQVSGTAVVTITNFKVVKTTAAGLTQAVNATTNEVDNRLIDINTDNTITMHDNESTAESFPEFILEPTKEITKIAITEQDGDDYLYLGSEVDPDTADQVVNNEPIRVSDRCQTLAYWQRFKNPTKTDSNDATTYLPPFELENAVIGKDSALTSNVNSILMGTDSKDHYQFGTTFTKGKWNGAGAIHNTFPGAYADWEIKVRMEIHSKYPRAMDKIEVFLLDQNNARMGKIMLKDFAVNRQVILQIQIGTQENYHKIYEEYGDKSKGKETKVELKTYKNGTKKKSTYTVKTKKKKKEKKIRYSYDHLPSSTSRSTFTNFYGNITVRKVGKKYSVSIMPLKSNGKNARRMPFTRSWSDVTGKFANAKLANCGLYIGKYPIAEDLAKPQKGYHNDRMCLDDLIVKEIIDGGNKETKTPTPIAGPGDEIHISTEDGTIYKNGQLFNSSNGHLIKAPGSNLLGLSLQGAAEKTYNLYPTEGWSIVHQPVYY